MRAPGCGVRVLDGDADTAQVAEFERGRRDLLRRGIGFGGAVVAAASIPLLLSVRNAFAQGGSDADILSKAIGLEGVAVLTYGSVIDSNLLTPAFTRVLRRFLDHERAHADTLETALKDLGGTQGDPDVETVERFGKGLVGLKSQSDVASLLIELELAAVAAYHDAQRRLIDARLLQMGAAIMANEAQHLVVLREAAGQPPVPNAFETGQK